jgi:hypothetical protein
LAQVLSRVPHRLGVDEVARLAVINQLIADTCIEVAAECDTPPSALYPLAATTVALGVAYKLELEFYPEQQSESAPGALLRRDWLEAIARLCRAISSLVTVDEVTGYTRMPVQFLVVPDPEYVEVPYRRPWPPRPL